MNMKKKLVLLAILTLAATAFAQYIPDEKETKQVDTSAVMKKAYNVRGGMNFSSLSMKYNTYGRYRSNSTFGFHIGAMMDMPLAIIDIANDAYIISVHPGAQFVKKGGKRSFYYVFSSYSYTVNAYYLEFPVLFSFKKDFSDNFSARADFGPYLAIGMFGDQEIGGYSAAYESESSFSEGGLSRVDGGIYYGTTLEFAKKYSLGFHAGSGFTDDNIYSLYITLGYKL
jgi:hypothetical protein